MRVPGTLFPKKFNTASSRRLRNKLVLFHARDSSSLVFWVKSPVDSDGRRSNRDANLSTTNFVYPARVGSLWNRCESDRISCLSSANSFNDSLRIQWRKGNDDRIVRRARIGRHRQITESNDPITRRLRCKLWIGGKFNLASKNKLTRTRDHYAPEYQLASNRSMQRSRRN